MKSIISLSILLFTSLHLHAQSLGMQHLGAIGGELIDAQGNGLIHGIGAVGSTVIENGVRLDQGMFLACDLFCDNRLHSIETALYENPMLSIYPNPTTSGLHLAGDPQQIHRYELYSSAGQLLRREILSETSLSLVDFPSGLYLLRVYDIHGALTFIGKIVKE
ncbi:MAG: T9SS type A sorting domain-containing protein [Bacteroidota bacterium]